jgi:hypothetical protein
VCTFTPCAAHHALRLSPLRSHAASRRAHIAAFVDPAIVALLAQVRASVNDGQVPAEGVVAGRLVRQPKLARDSR